ncbi:response regulator [Emcibacter sp.]|uniref:response regulator n=1 Tax=Emcibacter sp. TaxID=1979954 RepID=UPI002AA61B69|nr:response regulator [Emcibacter sp.]
MSLRDPKFEDKKVLLVDDDVYLGKIIKSVLDILDVGSVTWVKSVREGIKLYSQKPFDCVFVDCLKEDREGLQLLQAVRRGTDAEKIRVPVILCTAFTEKQTVFQARDFGVTEILAKPVSPEQILEKLASALFREREFVQGAGYIGPDRRRRRGDWDGKEDRRQSSRLTQTNIDQFMGDHPKFNKVEAASDAGEAANGR